MTWRGEEINNCRALPGAPLVEMPAPSSPAWHRTIRRAREASPRRRDDLPDVFFATS